MNYAHAGQSENTNTVTDDELLSSYDHDPYDRGVIGNEQGRQIGDSPKTYWPRRPFAVPSTQLSRDYAANDRCRLTVLAASNLSGRNEGAKRSSQE